MPALANISRAYFLFSFSSSLFFSFVIMRSPDAHTSISFVYIYIYLSFYAITAKRRNRTQRPNAQAIPFSCFSHANQVLNGIMMIVERRRKTEPTFDFFQCESSSFFLTDSFLCWIVACDNIRLAFILFS